jgi:hypothetical protein
VPTMQQQPGYTFNRMIDSRKVAEILGYGHDFVQRRMNEKHPEHIPNMRIGRKRYVSPEDLEEWVKSRRR